MHKVSKPENNLSHLFKAAKKSVKTMSILKTIMSSTKPITILVEGSSYQTNVDILDKLISVRNNPDDKLLLIDINPLVVSNYKLYIKKRFPSKNYKVIQADMNLLPFLNKTIDLVINNFTINFNTAKKNDIQTISEIKRVLKSKNSACLFSIGILIEPKIKIATVKKNASTIFYPSRSGVAKLYKEGFYYENLFFKSNIN
ncbi:MAG: class I SAM-dependent methyltransferase, partial [Patescibacteria group bacterium]